MGKIVARKAISPPCPFCKNPHVMIRKSRRGKETVEGHNYQVVCTKCRAEGPMVENSMQEAEKAWGNRV